MKPLYYIVVLSTLTLSLIAKEATVEQLFSVQTLTLTKTKQAKEHKSYGYIKVDESRRYDISSRFGGYVIELYANTLYQSIQKGQALLKLYSPEVYKAKDEYINAYKYSQKRPNKGMLEGARRKLELLGVNTQEIEALKHADAPTGYTYIYAPVDGYLFGKNLNAGSAFNAKDTLFEIVNLDEVWVETKLFEEQRANLSHLLNYQLHFKGIEQIYNATNPLLYPQLNPKEATLTLRLHVKNPKHELFPGMYTNVISYYDKKELLSLPKSAVLRKNGKHYVFLVGEFKGEYEPIEVQVKVIDTNTYAVIQGLDEGDEVVSNALFMMDSDAQINGLY